MIVRCRHRPTLIGTIEGVNYYCCDEDGIRDFDGEAIVNLTGVRNIPNPIDVPPELAEHLDAGLSEIVIPWADFGIPKVKNSFWKALHQYILEKKWTEVCIHCEGGHGRTGTAMAAIMIVNLGWSSKEAVEYLRDNYCKDVVETSEQCEYLCVLDIEYNDRQIKEDEAPIPSFYINDDDDTVIVTHAAEEVKGEIKDKGSKDD